MSRLENLILPVTFNNWNTYSYSPRVNTLMSLSFSMGAMPKPLAYVSTSPDYFFDDNGNVVNLLDQCKAIDGSETLEQDIIDMLQDVKDIENEPILDSNMPKQKILHVKNSIHTTQIVYGWDYLSIRPTNDLILMS